GCSGQKEKTINWQPTSTSDLLPHSSDYAETPLESEAGKALAYSAGAAVQTATGNVYFTSITVDKTQAFISCVKDVGALSVRGYQHKTDKIDVGVIAVGEKDQKKLLNCLIKTALPGSVTGKSYGLCGAAYSVKSPTSSYYVVFLGTSDGVCQVLCSKEKSNCVYTDDVTKIWMWEN
ncbi:MAG: hypothetical protein V1909_03905, partial [Candidatus Micrarchaeota archaeon]